MASRRFVSPGWLREPVCRDRHDDKFIEAALAAQVRTLLARDADLTVLEKPWSLDIFRADSTSQGAQPF
jgi:predicted nucleic acid-binding protein